jgi:hypothetical protein
MTYTPLAKTTINSATASSVVFSSISAAYTDLIIVTNVGYSAANYYTCLQFNADTASNYSATFLAGTGSSAVSNRTTSATFIADGNNIAGATTILDTVIFHIQNYANATTFKTVLVRKTSNGGSYPGTEAAVGLWRKTPETINSIKLFSSSAGNFAVGSTFSLYGISAIGGVTPKATGGTVTSDATYYYHTFEMSGNFVPNQSLSCDYLVVAGGGGGGYAAGGGGGGGGLKTGSAFSVTAQSYPITVGGGGKGGVSNSAIATSGSNSVFSSITSTGGGGGGNSGVLALAGGSGGGGGADGTARAGGAASPAGEGNAGGSSAAAYPYPTGGGGGAGAVGGTGSGSQSGAGGAGASNSTSGSAVIYSGGGGGASTLQGAASGAGGTGGGGAGSVGAVNGTAGTVNLGGGGGGASNNPDAFTRLGGNGGSGIVIVRYAK